MDAPTLNGINVPKWKCHRPLNEDTNVHHEYYNRRGQLPALGGSGRARLMRLRPYGEAAFGELGKVMAVNQAFRTAKA
jgi:hypothetical protein